MWRMCDETRRRRGVARSEQAKTRLSNKIRLEHELRPRKAVTLTGVHSGVTGCKCKYITTRNGKHTSVHEVRRVCRTADRVLLALRWLLLVIRVE